MKLKRTTQCAKCPWKKSTDPYDIPNGYCAKKHEKLDRTIAKSSTDWIKEQNFHIMACHESDIGDETPCLGWLMNQLGPGNNIMLRLKMLDNPELKSVKLIGPQHAKFQDTLPTN